jgi:hypothetical protein
MDAILRNSVLSQFTCLGERCEDTCCQGWSMQVDAPTLERYRQQAPQLLDSVEQQDDGLAIMRKNPDSLCVKFEGGLCGVQKEFGDRFLSDACYFYPRVSRSLGSSVVMTAAMSCPEIVRLALSDTPLIWEAVPVDRLPHGIKDYLPGGIAIEDALRIHAAFMEAAQADAPVELAFLRIASVSRSLARIGHASWPQAVVYYFQHADARLLQAEANISDPFNILHALCGLIVASKKTPSARLMQTIATMETALAATLDWQNVLISADDQSLAAYERVKARWRESGEGLYAPVLKRWLQMQLSLALYPFAGLGGNLPERLTIIGVRLATIRLALMCAYGITGSELPQDVVVRIIQSLSRFMDHLGDPLFSLQIYGETGWVNESRMRGIIEI